MMVVVVLGMHRSGTSLVANVLHHLGVHMGDRLLGANEWNPHGHWEDLDFLDLDVEMLKAAGGDWARPPEPERVREVGRWFRPEMDALVEWKAGQGRKLWGWKDPRTALLAGVWHQVVVEVDEVRYVHVVREQEAVIGSLMRRAAGAWETVRGWIEEGRVTEEEAENDRKMAGWGEDRWAALVHEYEGRIMDFLVAFKPVSAVVVFENLIDREMAEVTVTKLADFVGVDRGMVAGAVGRIEIREWRMEDDGKDAG